YADDLITPVDQTIRIVGYIQIASVRKAEGILAASPLQRIAGSDLEKCSSADADEGVGAVSSIERVSDARGRKLVGAQSSDQIIVVPRRGDRVNAVATIEGQVISYGNDRIGTVLPEDLRAIRPALCCRGIEHVL